MTGSIIRYREASSTTRINGKPWYMYWVEPSIQIRLDFKIKFINRQTAWYKMIARMKNINTQLFEWGEINCPGHYVLFGDTNEFYLSNYYKNRFINNRSGFSYLENFFVTDLNSGSFSYYLSGPLFKVYLDENISFYLN